MKGCAKFLNFIALIVFLFLALATVAVCAAAAVIFLKPELLSKEMEDLFNVITLNGHPIVPEMLKGYSQSVLIIIGAVILLMILSLVTISHIRTALREVGNEDPFSIRCSSALNTACILVVVSGLLGIALDIYMNYIFGDLTVDGSTAVQFTSDLSFILLAVFLRMLSGISAFGRSR